MTRIIAGAAGGAVLRVPPAGTRPTSDRVRESLFAALDARGSIDGARVLDLYAGSGALGLEAVSRGAHSADLVEKHRPAATIAERNVAAVTRAMPRVRVAVHVADAASYLARSSGPWDLVFIDPPYDVGNDAMRALLALLAPCLSPDALVIVERASRSGEPHGAGVPLELERSKRYGDTTLWWYQPASPDQSA